MDFEVKAHFGRLWNGCRSFYGCLRLGRRVWFVSRWDSGRVTLEKGYRRIWRSGEGQQDMTWYCGTWV